MTSYFEMNEKESHESIHLPEIKSQESIRAELNRMKWTRWQGEEIKEMKTRNDPNKSQ